MNIGMVFTLTCKRCKCSMEFRTNNYKAPVKEIVCQNCGQVLPAEHHAALFRAIDTMSTLPNSTVSTEGEGFKINYDVIPSPWADDPEF